MSNQTFPFILSIFIPGLGHLCLKKILFGIIFLSIDIATKLVVLNIIVTSSLVGTICVILYLSNWILCLIHVRKYKDTI